MRKKILISVLKVCCYVLILWMGFALGLAVALKSEDVFGSLISAFSINEPMLFIIMGVFFASLLIVLVIVMALKTPLNEIDFLSRKMFINFLCTPFAIGLLGAIIYRIVFLVANSYLFNF